MAIVEVRGVAEAKVWVPGFETGGGLV